MTWAMQAAVVLAVPLSLLGVGWAGVLAHRFAQDRRRTSAAMMTDIYVDSLPGIREFKGWLADLIDGEDSSGGSTTSNGYFDADGDVDGDTSDSSSD
jgi:hypothetical protein